MWPMREGFHDGEELFKRGDSIWASLLSGLRFCQLMPPGGDFFLKRGGSCVIFLGGLHGLGSRELGRFLRGRVYLFVIINFLMTRYPDESKVRRVSIHMTSGWM